MISLADAVDTAAPADAAKRKVTANKTKCAKIAAEIEKADAAAVAAAAASAATAISTAASPAAAAANAGKNLSMLILIQFNLYDFV